jgi:D-alanyl-D-alanine carboxypeptidase
MLKNIIKSIFFLSIIAFIAIACEKDKKRTEDTFELPLETQKSLNSVLEQKLLEYDIPGIIAGAWVPGKGNWEKTWGKADLVSGEDIELYDQVRIGDLTHSFTATIILKLVDQGVLSLDDFLDQIIATNIPDADKISIKHLLNMTSGIYNYAADSAFKAQVADDPLKKWSHQELINIALTHNPYNAPGLEWHYSHTNYIVLGLVIEQIIGISIEEIMAETIFDEYKLTYSSFPLFPNLNGEYANGYYPLGPDSLLQDITLFDPSSKWAAGGLVSNLYDLRDWAKLLVTGGMLTDSIQGLRENWIDGSVTTTDPYLMYGLGLMKEGGFIGYYGEIAGYQASMFYHPFHDATIVVLLNRTSDHNVSLEIFRELTSILFPKDVPWTQFID